MTNLLGELAPSGYFSGVVFRYHIEGGMVAKGSALVTARSSVPLTQKALSLASLALVV
jgi:hypothetical protein